jgi:SulP family sulfate permease
VLLATFVITVLFDLTLAIEVGVVLAAIIFMHRMAETTAASRAVSLIERDQDDFARPHSAYEARAELPNGVEVFELRGPLFFGAASRLADALEARVAVVLCGLQPGVHASLDRLGVLDAVRTAEKYEDALALAGAGN